MKHLPLLAIALMLAGCGQLPPNSMLGLSIENSANEGAAPIVSALEDAEFTDISAQADGSSIGVKMTYLYEVNPNMRFGLAYSLFGEKDYRIAANAPAGISTEEVARQVTPTHPNRAEIFGQASIAFSSKLSAVAGGGLIVQDSTEYTIADNAQVNEQTQHGITVGAHLGAQYELSEDSFAQIKFNAALDSLDESRIEAGIFTRFK